ncbi:MAG: TlpA family protein disulfide reductase [Acidobacteriota bacterium]|nr:TlpA family protein disulfide reductase [Acidobacteriota bacterium]
MSLFRLAIFCGTVWFILSGADVALAQKKRPPQNRRQTKSRVAKKTVKKPAPPKLAEPLVPVTRLDFAGLQALLKREPEAKRPLLINFWATWCTPCVEEFPELVKIDQEFRQRGLDFVTISLDDLAEINRDVPKFLAQMKADMPAYLLKTADEDAAIALVAPDWRGGLPFTVLLDNTGKIAYSRMGVIKPDILRTEIEKVLQPQSDTLNSN